MNEGTTGGTGTYSGGGYAVAEAKIKGPAIGLMITAGVGIFFNLLGILVNLMGIGMGTMFGQQEEAFAQFLGGTFGIVLSIVGILIGVVVFIGAQKMKALQSYGFAMTATILAMIPCLSPCCLLGLPIGIWALVVLLGQDVKGAFTS